MFIDLMRDQLIRLARKLEKENIKLIIGGGYGLILKHEYLRKKKLRTRFSDLPEDRSTNDIDAFLNTEIITNVEKTEKIRDTLKDLGYKTVAKYFQFEVSVSEESPEMKVRIDLLAPPVKDERKKYVKINKPRIRPKEATEIHAYLTEEAITIEEDLILFDFGNENEATEVFLPHPYSYLILKLFALRDRTELFDLKGLEKDEDKTKSHAFDIYRIIGMMTEKEWEQSIQLQNKYAEYSEIQKVEHIVNDLFSSMDAIGILRVRQHAKDADIEISEENLSSMVKDLTELFSIL